MARECTTLFLLIPQCTSSDEATCGGANLDTMVGIAKGSVSLAMERNT